jgi:hypothetical protein
VSRAEQRRLKASAFLDKADKHIAWINSFLSELHAFGVMDRGEDFERVLHSCLALVASTHKALEDSAKMAGLESWRADLEGERTKDPLLFYLWKARDIETHDIVTKWLAGVEAELLVVDSDKTNEFIETLEDANLENLSEKIFFKLYGVTNKKDFEQRVIGRHHPSRELLDSFGLKMEHAMTTFVFEDFSFRDKRGREIRVQAPTTHDGDNMTPSAFSSLQKAYLFYLKRSKDLRKICPAA